MLGREDERQGVRREREREIERPTGMLEETLILNYASVFVGKMFVFLSYFCQTVSVILPFILFFLSLALSCPAASPLITPRLTLARRDIPLKQTRVRNEGTEQRVFVGRGSSPGAFSYVFFPLLHFFSPSFFFVGVKKKSTRLTGCSKCSGSKNSTLPLRVMMGGIRTRVFS